MVRRLVIAGLTALLAAPAFLIEPASAAILFTCDSVTGSAVLAPGLAHDARAQSLSSGPTGPAGPAPIARASTSDTGVEAVGGWNLGAALSADGNVVAFTSGARNLDPADNDNSDDVYVKHLDTGDITLASTSDNGTKGNFGGDPSSASLSADGTKVGFTSFSNNLVPADTDRHYDAYVKNLRNGNLRLVSTSDTGVKGNGDSWMVALFAGGAKAVFYSSSTNLDPADTDDLQDVFIKDLQTGDLTLISTTALGVKGNRGVTSIFRPSADGTKFVLMTASSNWEDPIDTDARIDIYVKDLTTGALTLASTSDSGVKGNGASDWAALSGDGTKLVFHSDATNLDPGDTDRLFDVYVKDLRTGDITLVSTSDTGAKGDSDSQWPDISSDGAKVAFTSNATNLDPGHEPRVYYQAQEVYVKDLRTGDLTMASTSGTTVDGNDSSSFGTLSADGSRVGFNSRATNLVPPDNNFQPDVFVKQLPSTPTSLAISGCSNGNSGVASIVDIRSYGPRPLGCPSTFGGAAGNDYADTAPILVGAPVSMNIDWASGPNSYGVAAVKAGPTGTQWRFRLAITARPGHDTPATNQYLPDAGSGATKTRLQGKLDLGALDSSNCTSGTADPLSWLNLANNGAWVAESG